MGIFDSTPGTFNNGGTLRKSAGTATSTISLPLNNTGTVEMQAGTLNFSSGGMHSGPFSASNGATLQFGGGTHTLAATASVNAPSSNVILGGTAVSLGGTYNVTGTTTINGGTNTFSGNVTSGGNTLTVTAGTANFNSNAISVASFNLSGGTVSGSRSEERRVGKECRCRRGMEGGTGKTTVAAGAAFILAGGQPRLERALEEWADVGLAR